MLIRRLVAVLRPSDDSLMEVGDAVDLLYLGFFMALPDNHGYTLPSL